MARRVGIKNLIEDLEVIVGIRMVICLEIQIGRVKQRAENSERCCTWMFFFEKMFKVEYALKKEFCSTKTQLELSVPPFLGYHPSRERMFRYN